MERIKGKHRILKRVLIVIAIILGLILVTSGVIAIVTKVGSDALITAVNNVESVIYDHATIKPVLDENTGKAKLDENGAFNFVDSDGLLDKRNFNVLQLSDVHIGAGAFSMRTDNWTIKTVEDLIRRVQPDLVVVTGDIVYPVFFQSATLNNKKEARVFADLMERLGVYWTFAFGNHDTEIYSYFDREDIGNFYTHDEYKHCIFNNDVRTLSDGTKVHGVGNFAINIKDKLGDIVHTLFMVDSNSYLPDDPFGIKWNYDKIHDDQVKWYEETATKLGLDDNANAKSTIYFHIPLADHKKAIDYWRENGDNNYIVKRDGAMGEYEYGGTHVANDLYDALVSHGTTGLFVGHNHKNNASYWVDKDGFDKGNPGVRFTYGMSIDYLAYPGIYKLTAQRGGRMIELNSVEKIKCTDNVQYDKSHFAEDRLAGFVTYQVPYWNDLYKNR